MAGRVGDVLPVIHGSRARPVCRGLGDGHLPAAGPVSAILVAGTTSDAGKSIVTTGLCRAFARRGIKVAPFKAQNMSNNSMVCGGSDGTFAEIGRAQWIQALAARAEPEPAMNPVLLKPGSDRRSHVVVMGRPAGEVTRAPSWRAAASWPGGVRRVRRPVLALRRRGRGGRGQPDRDQPARQRLRQHGARPERSDAHRRRGRHRPRRRLRGDVRHRRAARAGRPEPGRRLRRQQVPRRPVAPRAGPPPSSSGSPAVGCIGVLPWHPGLWLDSEDALDLDGRRADVEQPAHGRGGPAAPDQQLHRRRRARSRGRCRGGSSPTPGRSPTQTSSSCPAPAPRSPISPGCGPVVSTAAIEQHVAAGRASARDLRRLPDARPHHRRRDRRRGRGGRRSPGSACSTYAPTSRRQGAAAAEGDAGTPPRLRDPPRPGRSASSRSSAGAGHVFGTMWHGSLEDDEFRQAFLTEVAHTAGRARTPSTTGFARAVRPGSSCSPTSSRSTWTSTRSSTWRSGAPVSRPPSRSPAMRVLLLGGTAEARALAAGLVADGVDVVSSLAGRVARPRLPVGEVRIGGFGGVDGLRDHVVAGRTTRSSTRRIRSRSRCRPTPRPSAG